VRIEELDYEYPKELIATTPASPRDSAKLLVFQEGEMIHSSFRHLSEFLKKGDVLVLNKTKVFPARIFGECLGRKVEVIFLNKITKNVWEVMIGGKVSDGETVALPDGLEIIITKNQNETKAKVPLSKNSLYKYLEKFGHTPLPPYMKREDNKNDKTEYQTVFAKRVGSAAAPTAGLHFTESLLEKLASSGVQIEYITLHVGLGTFAPVKTEKVEEHPIHSEYFEIDDLTAKRLNEAKKEGRRIIACGTTVVRSLESAISSGTIKPQKNETSLFITPGHRFECVDGIITNFHTPRSSLLALVYAFSGQENICKIYQEAIQNKYRLFSYGDGMLLLK